jgi:cyclopropane fatty-acyl-phospholipid synthase-like methyltransferase
VKAMKLYADVHRIYNELAALGLAPGAALAVEQLTPFDQYHYHGTDAIDEALAALGLAPRARVLDVGSGIGGPARYIAAKTDATVTALELQPDLDAVARDLTARCGLQARVEHVCGDILEWPAAGGGHDGLISLLCMLHIPDKARLFKACRAALKPGASMFIEDFAKAREPTPEEAELLATKVQCPVLPTPADYEAHLRDAGFAHVMLIDVSASWREYAAERFALFRAMRDRNLAVHGADVVDGLDDFYEAIAKLWNNGAILGLKIIAR